MTKLYHDDDSKQPTLHLFGIRKLQDVVPYIEGLPVDRHLLKSIKKYHCVGGLLLTLELKLRINRHQKGRMHILAGPDRRVSLADVS